MEAESRLERIRPGVETSDAATDRGWLFVLSDWPLHEAELKRRMAEVFANASSGQEFPMVLIVDDLAVRSQDHRRLLVNLAEMGGTILEAAGPGELEEAKRDPYRFAVQHLSVGEPVAESAIVQARPEPGQEEGYREFGKALTRLSPDELKEMVEGRPDGADWRYEW